MKIYFLLFFLLIFSFSCKSREYIELRHKNHQKLNNDEISIKISPLKNSDSAIVKIFQFEKIIKKKNENSKISYVKKNTKNIITIENYRDIIKNFNTIKEQDLKWPRTGKDSTGMAYILFIGFDGGNNSLIYRKGSFLKKFNVLGMSDLYGSFYSTTKLISESGGLKLEKID